MRILALNGTFDPKIRFTVSEIFDLPFIVISIVSRHCNRLWIAFDIQSNSSFGLLWIFLIDLRMVTLFSMQPCFNRYERRSAKIEFSFSVYFILFIIIIIFFYISSLIWRVRLDKLSRNSIRWNVPENAEESTATNLWPCFKRWPPVRKSISCLSVSLIATTSPQKTSRTFSNVSSRSVSLSFLSFFLSFFLSIFLSSSSSPLEYCSIIRQFIRNVCGSIKHFFEGGFQIL